MSFAGSLGRIATTSVLRFFFAAGWCKVCLFPKPSTQTDKCRWAMHDLGRCEFIVLAKGSAAPLQVHPSGFNRCSARFYVCRIVHCFCYVKRLF
mmetsp:Transcript_93355/g.185268  ORF Transcript_93355/g.185268 Transcript_93355/m.185268 type:complete len:94 (-) Transcript_93355:107-388(-)